MGFELVAEGHEITKVKEYWPGSAADIFSLGITAGKTTYCSYWDQNGTQVGHLRSYGSSVPSGKPNKVYTRIAGPTNEEKLQAKVDEMQAKMDQKDDEFQEQLQTAMKQQMKTMQSEMTAKQTTANLQIENMQTAMAERKEQIETMQSDMAQKTLAMDTMRINLTAMAEKEKATQAKLEAVQQSMEEHEKQRIEQLEEHKKILIAQLNEKQSDYEV